MPNSRDSYPLRSELGTCIEEICLLAKEGICRTKKTRMLVRQVILSIPRMLHRTIAGVRIFRRMIARLRMSPKTIAKVRMLQRTIARTTQVASNKSTKSLKK